jgi:hypothetical protein
LIWGSNGNVSRRGAGVHHYADWQMVKRRFSAFYLQTSRAILEGRFKADDQVLLLPNDPTSQTQIWLILNKMIKLKKRT